MKILFALILMLNLGKSFSKEIIYGIGDIFLEKMASSETYALVGYLELGGNKNKVAINDTFNLIFRNEVAKGVIIRNDNVAWKDYLKIKVFSVKNPTEVIRQTSFVYTNQVVAKGRRAIVPNIVSSFNMGKDSILKVCGGCAINYLYKLKGNEYFVIGSSSRGNYIFKAHLQNNYLKSDTVLSRSGILSIDKIQDLNRDEIIDFVYIQVTTPESYSQILVYYNERLRTYQIFEVNSKDC